MTFALADIGRLEGLAFYFGDDYFDPRHRLFRLCLLKNIRSLRYELRSRGAGDKAD